MIARLKANLSKLKKGEEAKNKNELTTITPKKIKKIKNIKKINKFTIEPEKPHCFLYRIQKINPEINLNYQLELYHKKQRYSVSKEDEMIDENKHGKFFFMRKNREELYVYKPSLSQRDRSNHFYMQNKKSIGKGLFRSISSTNFKGNKNYQNLDLSAIFKEKDKNNLFFDNSNNNKTATFFITNNKKASTKVSTKNNSVETSRIFSPRNIKYESNHKKNKLSSEKLIYLQIKGIKLKNKIMDTLDKANNASMEFAQEIDNSKNYDKIFGLNKDENLFKNYKKINEKKFKIEKLFINRINENKNRQNLLPRSFQYLDNEGKKIWMEAKEYDKYKQDFLNKNPSKKFFHLNSKFYVNKLISELNELGSDILATKKKFKGEDAIEPKNEKKFFHGFVKENLLVNLADEKYIEEIMRRKSVADSLDNKQEKRLFALKQKSLAMRHKVGKSNAI